MGVELSLMLLCIPGILSFYWVAFDKPGYEDLCLVLYMAMLFSVYIPGRLIFSEGKGKSTGSEREERRGSGAGR